MSLKLNIGCGPYKRLERGWLNMDSNPRMKPEILRDVRRGLPFSNESLVEVSTSHFLEHLANDDLIFLIGEIYRVLEPGGIWSIVAPLGCTGDLDHKMQFTADSFDVLLRPESADYYQTPMAWREPAGARVIRPEVRGIKSLHLILVAVK
jgi:predicted SAM-dependent methyltransferase